MNSNQIAAAAGKRRLRRESPERRAARLRQGQVRQNIIQAATHFLQKEPASKVSLSRLAIQAGLRAPTDIYAHFRTKDELVAVTMTRPLAAQLEMLPASAGVLDVWAVVLVWRQSWPVVESTATLYERVAHEVGDALALRACIELNMGPGHLVHLLTALALGGASDQDADTIMKRLFQVK
jgi:AcrR family transcriptional regulator